MNIRKGLVYLYCSFVSVISASVGTTDTFLVALFQQVSKEQVLEEQPYKPLRSWEKIKGVYSSNIVLNFHGKLPLAEARRHIRIFDSNMFVTAWVTSSLLEAHIYGSAPRPSDEQLTLSINALKNFQDKNQPYNTSIMSFWQQRFNKSTNHWECKPVNLLGCFSLLNHLPLHMIETFLKVMGLNEIAKFIEAIKEQESSFLRAFHFPPDFDDTFLNLGMGSLLFQRKEEFPVAWKLWNSYNRNLTSVFNALKRYAYLPFSNDSNLNSIDPRTYMHIRGFLDQAKTNGQDVALVPTWVQNIDEDREEFYQGEAMPFQVNNVDVTVAANVIFGITSSVLSGLVSPDVLKDPLIAKIYQNSSSLIAYEIMSNFSDRPDLALTYYPSRMEFYWFVTRTVDMLESARRNGTMLVKVMDTVYKILRDVVDRDMTKSILSMAYKEGTDLVYFDDFLGDGDISLDGRPLIRGEDRIVTTAMAANALLSAWTYYDVILGKSRWMEETPKTVRETVTGCVNWLRRYTLGQRYDPWNAFFSGSVKGFQSLPFWYPGNRLEYLNGTIITDWSNLPNSTFIYAVRGYVPADQYNAMLKQKHFGHPTPMSFDGYNNGSNFFPIWSSVPYTYSTTLLAVSRFSNCVV